MERFDDREIEAVTNVIKSGKLSRFFQSFFGGENIIGFEVEVADYLGVKHAISVCNGTISLEIILKALRIGKGDEVILSPLTFIATGTAILSVGAKPVFVDIDPQTLNLDPNKIEGVITKKTVAIIAVSLCGFPAALPHLYGICNDYGIYLIEDAAQSLGAKIGDYKVGSYGDLSSFSFQETKQISTLGEGGAIITSDDRLADLCRNIRNHGNGYGSLNDIVCTNARMTEAQAAFGRVQLTKLDEFNKIQIENAEYFLSHLPKFLSSVYNFPIPNGLQPIYLLIPTIYHGKLSRDDFIEDLKGLGISLGLPGQNVGYYKKLLYDYPIFAKYRRKCPNAEWARDHILLLDVHRWGKTIKDMDELIKILNKTF